MHDSGTWIPETESIDAMREIVISVRHESADMYMSTWQIQALAGGDVEVAGDFVQSVGTVDSARVVWSVGEVAPRRELAEVCREAVFPQEVL